MNSEIPGGSCAFSWHARLHTGHCRLDQTGHWIDRILTQSEVRPHKIRSYVERRDPEFERKMVEVLHVYKDVEIVNAGLVEGTLKESSTVTISYDEKPGIQALAPTTPDRPPVAESAPQSSAGLRVQTNGDRIAAGRRLLADSSVKQEAVTDTSIELSRSCRCFPRD